MYIHINYMTTSTLLKNLDTELYPENIVAVDPMSSINFVTKMQWTHSPDYLYPQPIYSLTIYKVILKGVVLIKH